MDWREWGIIRPIDDQRFCGSCYAFSTAHSVEAVNAIRTGKVYHVSKQHIIDCSSADSSYYCSGCLGGTLFGATTFLHDSGIYAEADYPYASGATGNPTSCNADNLTEIDPSEVFVIEAIRATNFDANSRADFIKALLV